jgi:hypothetical protein
MPKSRAKNLLLILSILFATSPVGWGAEAPRIVEKNGRHALMVDGAPFLVLGAQIAVLVALFPGSRQAGTYAYNSLD